MNSAGRQSAVLAIAAYSFAKPSETFIRTHVATTAPGRTVLVSWEHCAPQMLGCPALSLHGSLPPVLRRAVHFIPNLLRAACGGEAVLGPLPRRRLAAFLARHGAGRVLVEYGPLGCLLGAVCATADIPFFVHFHGQDASAALKSRMQVEAYRRMFERAAGIIAPSRFIAARLAGIGCPPGKLHVVPCGIDPEKFRPSTRVPGRLVAVGRLVEKKAPHLTIEAFSQIAGTFPDARLEVIGDGPLATLCRSTIAASRLDGKVTLHGVRDSAFVASRLEQASVFVQHSVTAKNGDTEGLPVAILEAMAASLPVVATRHSGIPEAVADGTTGLLVEERDTAAMAAAMAELLRNPERAAAMGSAGRDRLIRCFTETMTAERLRSIMDLADRGQAG